MLTFIQKVNKQLNTTDPKFMPSINLYLFYNHVHKEYGYLWNISVLLEIILMYNVYVTTARIIINLLPPFI